MSDDNQMIMLGDQQFSLADLAGFDMTAVQAKKFENLNEGYYLFEVTADPAPGVVVRGTPPKGAVVIPCKVLDVIALKTPAEVPDATKLIGKIHYETNVINSAESLEYVQTTLENFGAGKPDGFSKGPLTGMLASLVGIKFKAHIKWRVNSNNTDIVYAGLSKIEVTERPAVSGVAQALVA